MRTLNSQEMTLVNGGADATEQKEYDTTTIGYGIARMIVSLVATSVGIFPGIGEKLEIWLNGTYDPDAPPTRSPSNGVYYLGSALDFIFGFIPGYKK